MTGIWAIILAAGESRRMGSPKMLLPFGEVTVIEKVVENVLAAGAEGTMIVLGSDSDEIMKLITRFPVRLCFNDNYISGMLSSVQCGFKSLPNACRAALIVPGDQPMIGAGEIRKVIEAWNASGKGIVMPACNGKRGHPLVVDMKYFADILSLPGEDGLRALSERHPDDVLEVQTDDPSVLRDIDTREDYLNELNIIKRDGRNNPVQT